MKQDKVVIDRVISMEVTAKLIVLTTKFGLIKDKITNQDYLVQKIWTRSEL